MAKRNGFTLIELLVVLAIVAMLLTIATPRYFGALQRSKEAALRESLTTLRQSMDAFHADKGRYPQSLEELVLNKYLRVVPTDPITESTATWVLIPESQGVWADVKSGASGVDSRGQAYASY